MSQLLMHDSVLVLTVVSGDENGRLFLVDRSPMIIGRGEEADIQLSPNDLTVRRQHIALQHTAGGWEISELTSGKNSPNVNGVRQSRCFLADGDVVTLGNTSIRVGFGHTFQCKFCGKDLSTKANSDNRAMELSGVAIYVCSEHIERVPALRGQSMRGHLSSSGTRIEYELCSVLGKGGAGVVYQVYDRATARVLALKCLADLTNIEQIRRFDLEMRELKDLRHINIVRFVDNDVDEHDVPFLVTEWVPDGSLEDLLSRERSLPLRTLCSMFLEILDGLKFVHQRSDVHRDIKPQNILIRVSRQNLQTPPKYFPKIADFGLIKKLNGIRITKPNDASGSVGFMAPEQVINFSTLDVRADVYSLGATFYFALTGMPPVDLPGDDRQAEQLRSVLYSERVPVRKRIRDVPLTLAAVVDKACQKEPSHRFRDAEEFQDALRNANEQLS